MSIPALPIQRHAAAISFELTEFTVGVTFPEPFQVGQTAFALCMHLLLMLSDRTAQREIHLFGDFNRCDPAGIVGVEAETEESGSIMVTFHACPFRLDISSGGRGRQHER